MPTEFTIFGSGFGAGLLLSILFGFLVWMRMSSQSKRDIEALRHRARMDKRQTENLSRNQHETIEAQTDIIERQKTLIEELRVQVNDLEVNGVAVVQELTDPDRVDDLEQLIEDNKRRIAELEMALQSEKAQSRQKMDVLKERLGALLSEIENKPSTRESTKDMARQIKTQIFGPAAPAANTDTAPESEEVAKRLSFASSKSSVPAVGSKEKRWKRRRWTG